jgi:hypothetical protein
MFSSQFSTTPFGRFLPTVFLVVTVLAVPLSAQTRLKIASIPPEYTPTAGPGLPEPVSMQSFSFEVEKETGRARVVVEYTYPDQPAFGSDGGIGPEPTMTQIPGLRYDQEARAVVYQEPDKIVTCATVGTRKFLFWHHLAVTPTGACTVSSSLTSHAEDNGWRIERHQAIDTFFVAK